MTILNRTQTSGVPDQGHRGKVSLVPSGATLLGPLSKILEKSPPKSYTEHDTKELEPSPAIPTWNLPPQKNPHPDTTIPSYPTAEPPPGQDVVQEYRLTPHFTSDTHILILMAGVASWIPIGKARRGDTVIQSLPSGNIGELKGAQSAILEQVWFFKEGGEDIDMIRIGMACITANHPVLTDDGWILASQAAPKGHGQLLDREYFQLCGLQLATGGNILINISISQDLAPVYIEVATMGYCFSPPSEPLNGSFPIYALQRTGPRDDCKTPTKPSYSQVTTLHYKGISTRPFLPPTLLIPEKHASPKVMDDSEKTAKEHKRKPMTDISATAHLDAKTTRRTPEENSGGLDTARTGSQRTSPTGIQHGRREGVQRDGPEIVHEGHEAVRRVQDTREGGIGHAVEVQSHLRIPGPMLPRAPASSGAGVDQALTDQQLIRHIMRDAGLSHQDKQLQVQAIWAGHFDRVNMPASFTNHRAGPSPPITPPSPAMNALIELEVLPLEDTTNTTRHVTPAILTLANSDGVPNPQLEGTGIPDSSPDILIQTPGGQNVPEHEVRWEPNPHTRDGGDNLLLLEVVPGHYLFQANFFAVNLCNLAESDLRSQFYKFPPIEEASTTSSLPSQGGNGLTPEPLFPRGHGRTIKRRERYAAQRLVRVAEEKEQIINSVMKELMNSVMTILRNKATAPSPSHKLGRPDTDLGVPFMSQVPPLIAGGATLYDHNFYYYRNGNPKPKIDPTARPLPRGLTSKERKRRRGRKSNRRRNKRGRPSNEVSKAPNSTMTEKTQGGDEPTLTGSDVIFPSPCQHTDTILGSTPAERMATEGAACFGPNTALLGQDPLSWEASITSSLSSQGGNGPTPEPLLPRGTSRTIKRRDRYAVQRKVRDIEKKEQIINSVMEQLMNSAMKILRDKATAPRPSHIQGQPDANLEVLSMSQGPALIANEATLYDHNLFYRNGKSKSKIDPTVRPLPRGLTSTVRQRLGGRKRNRRRNQRDRIDEALNAPNPTTTTQTQGGDEPTLTGSDGILLSPCQHTDTMLGSTPADWMATEGAACFGPNTALLGQDPLSWATHVPVDTLTRPIASLKKGDTVLAEKHDKFFVARVTCVITFEVPQAADSTANRVLQDTTLSTGLGVTLTRHHHIRNFGYIRLDKHGRWQLAAQEADTQWKVAADFTRHPTRTRQPHTTPVTRVFNLVLDPPGNVVILAPNHKIYISASLGYHMRRGKEPEDRTVQMGEIPVYTRGDALQLQGLSEFSRGLIQWGHGAATRANDGRLTFHRHKMLRRGYNHFHDQPPETLSNIIDTLLVTEDNMWQLRKWRQVCQRWQLHIDSYIQPEGHWQRHLRKELQDLWLSLYRWAIALVQHKDVELMNVGPYPALNLLSRDLGEALKRFGFSRAFVGGVALIISILTRPNEPFFVTLGPNINWANVYPCIQERHALQSLLSAGLSRHGLAPTPWHSSRTGPGTIPPGFSDTYPDTLPRLTEYPDPVPPRVASLTQTILPIFQDPPLARTEAQHRGLDILQILHALLDLGNPTENVPDHLSLSNGAIWDFQHHHRSLIHDLRELLPILFLTHQQRPYRAELGRVGRALLVELLSLRRSRAAARPDPIHVQHFTHLWLIPVPGRTRQPTMAADWADTLSIWIHPHGTLANQFGHREDQVETCEGLADPERLEQWDRDSQRLGFSFLNLLSTTPEANPTHDNHWREFVLAMSFSRDLLASLTHAIAHPLTDNLVTVSLQGIESLYTELEAKPWTPEESEVLTMINLITSEGLLSHVLIKTRRQCQSQESQPYTDAALLLLTLSLRANTGEARIRMELSQAVYTLSVEGDVHTLDLLLGWLEDALPEFHWMWPTVGQAKTVPLLISRLDSTCHQTHKLSDMNSCLRAVEVLCLLCQDLSFCKDILEIGTHRLLQTADRARRMQMSRPNEHDPIRSRALDIQLTIIECVNRTTATRPQADPPPGNTRAPLRGWSVEITWQWILQTMLALKSISAQQRPHRTNINYAAGLRTLHHLLTIEFHLTTQQRVNAWLLLGREEISELYAHFICAQLQEIDGNAVVGMATVLEGHTQALSRVSRQPTATEDVIYRSLGLLDIICPRG